jgi:hypothetical protein
MRVCENINCSFIRAGRKAARFEDAVAACSHCGKPLSVAFVEGASVPASAPTLELTGVPLDSVGVCTGPWIAVEAAPGGRIAIGVAMVIGLLGISIIAGGHDSTAAVFGLPLVVAAMAVGVWVAARNPSGSVRLYEHGFEIERGSQNIAIAFGNIRSATLTTIEWKRYGIRTHWTHRLDLDLDVGALSLDGVEPRENASPQGDFYAFAQHVVRTNQQRVR